MKVVHLSISHRGGAGIAAARSVAALRQRGIDAELWSIDGEPADPSLRNIPSSRWRSRLENLPLRLYRHRRLFSAWSTNWMPTHLSDRINREKPDIVHLHWLGAGFMNLREIGRISVPTVWTLHDAWGITGGCHYPDSCRRFVAACGRCPQLGSTRLHDLSWFNLRAKRRCLTKLSAAVAPSEWLASLVRECGIFPEERLHVIPNGLDGADYRPLDRGRSRAALDLPADAIGLVAGAHDLGEPRKGVHLLRETMTILTRERPGEYRVLLYGSGAENAGFGEWPCRVHWLGAISSATELARVLSAADVCLLPSLQDNLPNIALEAQACGCPVVGFDAGGLGEIIEPMRTGWLARQISPAALAEAISSWLEYAGGKTVSSEARARFESRFTLAEHGRQLESLYSTL